MLEWLSDLFYDPWIFWGIPLIPAMLLEGLRRWRRSMAAAEDDS